VGAAPTRSRELLRTLANRWLPCRSCVRAGAGTTRLSHPLRRRFLMAVPARGDRIVGTGTGLSRVTEGIRWARRDRHKRIPEDRACRISRFINQRTVANRFINHHSGNRRTAVIRPPNHRLRHDTHRTSIERKQKELALCSEDRTRYTVSQGGQSRG
jgi:hypothetical protein